MRPLIYSLLTAVALLTLVNACRPGWGPRGCSGGSCGPVGPMAQPMHQSVYRPGAGGACSDECSCGCNAGPETACGCIRRAATLAKSSADPFAQANAAPPSAASLPRWMTHGVEHEPSGQERYSISGIDVPKQVAATAIQSGQLADDSGKIRFTVIGSVEQRRQVLKDLDAHPALSAFKELFVVNAYSPEQWAVSRAGFVTNGTPTIYVQAPDGTVLHRQDDYVGGADSLAAALGRSAERKPNPDYQPAKDPDRRKTDPVSDPWLWLALAGGVVFILGAGLVSALIVITGR
jgi:hypothetical protein